MNITPFQVAHQFIGTKELTGDADNPMILAFISTCDPIAGDMHDEIPWCSAFVNFVHKCLGLPRTKSLAARSWLTMGSGVTVPIPGDVVILSRGANQNQGHVGFLAGLTYNNDGTLIEILGGNQNNQVSIELFEYDNLLGIRRFTGD